MKPSAATSWISNFVWTMGMIALPETGSLKIHSTNTKRRGFYLLEPTKPLQLLWLCQEKGDDSVTPPPLLYFPCSLIYFPPLSSLSLTLQDDGTHSTCFLTAVAVSLESHCIGQAEILLSGWCDLQIQKCQSFIVLDSPAFFSFLQGLGVEAAFRNKDLGLDLKEKSP